MGEVYRARDQRLGRDVAIKILTPRIAADRDAIVRFEREARALAALNHPNIAAIYDVIENNGQPALVLELVEGDTLADRIAGTRLSIVAAVDIAKQIADALDTAHEAGIVHRDLKPGNIKITDAGLVKLLDFGLAKAIAAAAGETSEVDAANSPTLTVPGTRQGSILGTAPYMSPEQARGTRVDKRTDIWAFGCVLFEMLTGKRAFNGETTSDVIAAIIERAPDLSALPAATPPHVRRVIERCLEKEPKRRARDIADVGAALERSPPAAALVRSTTSPALMAAALLVIALAGYAAVTWPDRSAPAALPPVEFTFGAAEGYRLIAAPPAPSPDGTMVAFGALDATQVSSIWIRPLDGTARRLDGTEGAVSARWSPDSQSLMFFSGGSWKRMSAAGGPAITVVPEAVANLGLSWGSGDELVVALANRTALSRVPASGGTPRPLTTLNVENENSHRWPQLLPDGRHFLFTVRSDRPENLGIKIGSFDSPEVRPLSAVASQGVYAEPGWLLFMTPDEVLVAQRIDPATWTLRGSPQPLAAPVLYNGPSFLGGFDASLNGRVLTYLAGTRPASSLHWYDRTGKPLGRVGPERPYRGFRVAPDGRRVAVELADERYGTRDLWLLDTATQSLSRLTTNNATDWRAAFSPDGLTIAFATDRAGASTIMRTSTNGTAGESLVLRDATGGVFPADWSRDGTRLLVSRDDPQGRPRTLLLVPANGGAATVVVDGEPFDVNLNRLSPGGDLIAFMSLTTGTREIYVMSVDGQRRIRVSDEGGSSPLWGATNRDLYYLNARGQVMHATLDGQSLALVGRPAPVFSPCVDQKLEFPLDAVDERIDLTGDGTRFLAACRQAAPPPVITVVVNWQSRLR
jgi:Tol biopolymer transport system component